MGEAEREAAERIAAQAKRVEPEITRELSEIVSGIQTAELLDLAFRLKKVERIEEKLEGDAQIKGSLAVAEAELFDALRYTVVLNEDYVEGIYAIIEALAQRGVVLVRSKNSWGNQGYQAVNAVFRDPDGIPFEVQFHTSESRALRNGAHGLYERVRDPNVDRVERGELYDQTVAVWRPVCSRPPPGADSMPGLAR